MKNNKDLILNIQRMYYLLTALDIQQEWLRDYLDKDFKKHLNESKAKNNHLRKIIKNNLTPKEIQDIELIGDSIIEKIWSEIK
jgi:DNA topoisomerase IB